MWFNSLFLLGLLLGLARGAVELSEPEQLALEVSGVMLPPKRLSSRLQEHLKSIRKIFPDMERVVHRPKFIPGELILAPITSLEEQEAIVHKINGSRYGPVVLDIKKDSKDRATYHLVFTKPFHPTRLVERMASELSVENVEENFVTGEGDEISYHATAPTYYTYVFKKGWGDCASGCVNKHYWQYTVAPSEETLTVKLEKEYGSDLPS